LRSRLGRVHRVDITIQVQHGCHRISSPTANL
jgi:hypothetical protein